MPVKPIPDVTQAEVREFFRYDADARGLVWRKRPPRSSVKIGARAGVQAKNGYRVIGFKGGQISEHRLVFLYHKGWMPDALDHRDQDKTNNRIGNLRPAGKSLNGHNTPPRGKVPFKGVSFNKGNKHRKYEAYISVEGNARSLGAYATPEEAARVYDAEARRLRGPNAVTNASLGLLENDDARPRL